MLTVLQDNFKVWLLTDVSAWVKVQIKSYAKDNNGFYLIVNVRDRKKQEWGGERGRRRWRSNRISRKISPLIDPDSRTFFTLVFLVMGVLETFFWQQQVYIVQVMGIHRVVAAIPITWSDKFISSCFLSHSLSQWEVFVWMH